MSGDLLADTAEGLIEQLGQELKPLRKTEDIPSTRGGKTPTPHGEGQGGVKGQWNLQFSSEDPTKLAMIVTVNVHVPTPILLKFSSELDKLHVNKLVEWLSRIMTNMEEI